MTESGCVGKQADDEDVEKEDEPCVAHFVKHYSCFHWQVLNDEETAYGCGHPQKEHSGYGQLHGPSRRGDHPQMPGDISREAYNEEKKNDEKHGCSHSGSF